MSCKITKPLLAVAADLDTLRMPVLCSPKLDGIRALTIDGELLSRKFKPIPNDYVRNMLSGLPDGLDGELIAVGGNFNSCQSAFMSIKGEPQFKYYLFDYVSGELSEPAYERLLKLQLLVENIKEAHPHFEDILVVVEQNMVHNLDELMAYEEKYVQEGYEGLMIRSLAGKYKCGRSTTREQILLKLKRWVDAEARIIGFEEKMHNENEAKEDELGHIKRSSCKEGMIPANTLGAFITRELESGVVVNVGSGLDDELRQKIWDNKDDYLGRIITFKYQATAGRELTETTKPSFPIFKGFRNEIDIGE